MQIWCKNDDFNDQDFLQPGTLIELQESIRSNQKIRAWGTAHSFNKIANTSSYAINLAKMPRLIEVNADRTSVKIAAGLTYGELALVCHIQGWAFNNLASLSQISIAGSILTGTHGSGIENQNLANQVSSFDIVTSECDLQHIDRTTPLFNALIISLGLSGIVYQ